MPGGKVLTVLPVAAFGVGISRLAATVDDARGRGLEVGED
jgi:hypothetical protein